MNTIIELVTSQDTFLLKSIVVFWMFCVVSFYSSLLYGVGYVVYNKFVKK